ncbi:MAG: hypothetical protein HFF18_08110 [Oscillospiraceae bacterium]|nr:hypothetical protein [Oscillospiraceae bacterium]
MKLLKKGDPCPCCGSPIPTDDLERLLLLSWLAQYPMIRDVILHRPDALEPPPRWADHMIQRFTKTE